MNCFERPVEFQVPEKNEWEVKLDSYGDVLGPISWEKPSSVWVGGFSGKILKIQSRYKVVGMNYEGNSLNLYEAKFSDRLMKCLKNF